jgi:hypothetical protein
MRQFNDSSSTICLVQGRLTNYHSRTHISQHLLDLNHGAMAESAAVARTAQ